MTPHPHTFPHTPHLSSPLVSEDHFITCPVHTVHCLPSLHRLTDASFVHHQTKEAPFLLTFPHTYLFTPLRKKEK